LHRSTHKTESGIKIAETQAIDAWNGVVPRRAVRVGPAEVNGIVTAGVKLEGALPKGARPDLSVDGTVELELCD